MTELADVECPGISKTLMLPRPSKGFMPGDESTWVLVGLLGLQKITVCGVQGRKVSSTSLCVMCMGGRSPEHHCA